eukprot:m.56356 g.56356  ORF g.56356 m.56356 type:complete len:120 (+) comp22234_c1_seq1:291-650(+)
MIHDEWVEPEGVEKTITVIGAENPRVNGVFKSEGYVNFKPTYSKIGDDGVVISFFKSSFPWVLSIHSVLGEVQSTIGHYGAWNKFNREVNPPRTGWCRYDSADTNSKMTIAYGEQAEPA